ncbi:MAG: cytochrome c [Betaproteobacteria bacterium]|nr:cytochrome c [Betaproteobacteria bacterium]
MINDKVRKLVVGCALLLAAGPSLAADPDTQKQLDGIKAAIPKFAIPMREVGDRFQNIYFAAHGGNWALAAYMSKYMNGAMNPAMLTKPAEYAVWKNFNDNTFASVNKAIMAKDVKAFDTAYKAVVDDCNSCHKGMGYGFIKVVKLGGPADSGIDYKVKSEPGDVPK